MGGVQRRTFLELGAGAAIAPVVPKRRYSAWDEVQLGKTGIRTSRLCFGTGFKAGRRRSTLTDDGKEKAISLLRAAYERGIRCFDAADIYGTHSVIAEALSPFPRDSWTVLTKIWLHKGQIPETDRGSVKSIVERFCKELKTDHVDVVQLHCIMRGGWSQSFAKEMEELEQCKCEGKIRAHGLSFHNLQALREAVSNPWAEVCHVRINPFQVLTDGKPEEVLAVAKALRERGAGVLAMKLLGEGWASHYPAKITESLAFALKNGAADVLDIGFLDIKEIDDIAERIAGIS